MRRLPPIYRVASHGSGAVSHEGTSRKAGRSAWRNRIVVPLGFSPLANVCDSHRSDVPLQLLGSEWMS